MYTIKQTPQDFIVEEIIDLSTIIAEPQKKFLIYTLTKSDETTLHCIKRLAQKIGIEEKLIGFCGLKDKNATTSQYISIPNFGTKTARERVESLSSGTVTLKFAGSRDTPLFIGALLANRFTIKAANISGYKVVKQQQMINYFGEQRFSEQNAAIGKLLITKKFAQARDLILQEGIDKGDKVSAELTQYREKNPNDAVGALRRLSPKLLMLYIHAFQSKLWNNIASTIAQRTFSDFFVDEKLHIAIPAEIKNAYENGANIHETKIPIIGFDYEEEKYDDSLKQLIADELRNEKMSLRDFISKEFPELTKSGGKRDFIVQIGELQITDLREKPKTGILPHSETTEDAIIVSFLLEKGSYATVALRHILIHE